MSERFRPFTNDELAVLGVGLAMVGVEADLQTEASPLLKEINEEMARAERQKVGK